MNGFKTDLYLPDKGNLFKPDKGNLFQTSTLQFNNTLIFKKSLNVIQMLLYDRS